MDDAKTSTGQIVRQPMVVRLSQHQRLVISAVMGGLVFVALLFISPWILAALAGWDAAALVILGTIWPFVSRFDAAATRAVATREDDSRAAVDLIVVTACVASLVGVVLGLAEAKAASHLLTTVLTSVAVATVALSWFTVHTMFVLRYAHLYYRGTPGGIDFPDVDEPDYRDFVYLALTIGMTFQVSDTPIGDRDIRHVVIRHALLSYLFGTVIVGVTINILGGLV